MAHETVSTDIAIIGGGIIGACTGLFLAQEEAGSGASIALLEGRSVGRQASGVNAGTVSLQNKPLPLTRACLEAHAVWTELDQQLDHRLGFEVRGGLRVAQTEQEERDLADGYEKRKADTLPLEWLSGDELHREFPWLSRSVRAATFCPLDSQADALVATARVMQAAQRAGVRVLPYNPVVRVERSGERWVLFTERLRINAGRVVVATGSWTEGVSALFGCGTPIVRKVQQVMITDNLPPLMPVVLTHQNGSLSLKQLWHGRVLIGGGWPGERDESGYTTWIRWDSIVGNLELAVSVVPGLQGGRLLRMWAGVEGETPDRLPYLGTYPGVPDVVFAVSGYGGFSLGPWLARKAVGLLLGRNPQIAPAYAPDRFSLS